jgi:hypothetical protein
MTPIAFTNRLPPKRVVDRDSWLRGHGYSRLTSLLLLPLRRLAADGADHKLNEVLPMLSSMKVSSFK